MIVSMIKTEWADSDSLAHNTYREATNLCSPRQSPPTSTTSYDDWNLVHEIRVSGSYQTSHVDYFWGPDLSGTLQGAGGVGGLVAVSVDGDFYFPGYDNNGNVIGYWDERGRLAAEFVYDAFGNPVGGHDAPYVHLPHRFSTKYHDAETDLYYYGYRYYSPSLGRWLSRDPIGEKDKSNLYLFVGNHPDLAVDCNGQDSYTKSEDGKQPPLGLIRAHEMGHARNVLENLKPCVDAKFKIEFGSRTLKSSDTAKVRSIIDTCRRAKFPDESRLTKEATHNWLMENGFSETKRTRDSLYEK